MCEVGVSRCRRQALKCSRRQPGASTLCCILGVPRHGDELPLEIERLWRTLAHNRRNIIPMLDFLASLGTHMSYQVCVTQHMPDCSAQHDTAHAVFLAAAHGVGL